MKRKPRIVITYLEAGMGHIVSAKAISDALKKDFGDKLEIFDVWLAKESPVLKEFQENLVKEVKKSNKNPAYGNFQFLCMNLFGRNASLKFTQNTVFANAKNEMFRVFAKYRPDMIISTHFSPHYASIELRNKYLKNTIVATYDPDPNVHGWWDNRSDLFFVNNEYAKKQAIENSKFLPSGVKQVGFTAREQILNCKLSKQECRTKYDLPQDNFTVMLADGAYASSKLKEYANEFCKITKPLTLVLIAGKNEKVKQYFEDKMKTLPSNITMKVFGFVENIHELYIASDLFVTKAGPNAIQDSIFCGTPIMVNFYANPVEKFTQKLFVKDYKCGETVLDKIKAKKKLEKWIAKPELLDCYRENCKKLDSRKNGATDIAKEIFRALKYYKPHLFE